MVWSGRIKYERKAQGSREGVWNRHERKPEKKLIGIINIIIQRKGDWQDVMRLINEAS